MIRRILDGLFAVAGAAGFAQFPAFFQQYLQRLGGRRDQASQDIAQIRQDAQNLGQSLKAHLEELMASGTSEARQAAARELERVDNAEQLETAYKALVEAGPLQRPTVFAEYFDANIAAEAAKIFQPAVPVTTEAVIYAALGMLVALALLAGGEAGGRQVIGRIKGY
jgi:hypothetical protein